MVIFITGGAKGIGRALAEKFLNKGDTVYLNYNQSIKEANSLKEKFPKVILVPGDITNEATIKNIFNKIHNEQGKLDLLINNACYYNDTLYPEKTKKDFMRVLEVNLVAPFLLMKEYSLNFKTGKVLNLLSTDGIDTYNEYNYDYAASKAGLINLTKSMSKSIPNLKIYGLVLNYVKTECTLKMDQEYLKSELKRIGQKELITLDHVCDKVLNIINEDFDTGYIERVDNNE